MQPPHHGCSPLLIFEEGWRRSRRRPPWMAEVRATQEQLPGWWGGRTHPVSTLTDIKNN